VRYVELEGEEHLNHSALQTKLFLIGLRPRNLNMPLAAKWALQPLVVESLISGKKWKMDEDAWSK